MTDTERAAHDEQTRIRRILMADDPTTRALTDRERRLITHVGMFGSDGYPVSKVGSKHWAYEGGPRVFPTKREAVAAFEAYFDVLLDLLAVERMRETR